MIKISIIMIGQMVLLGLFCIIAFLWAVITCTLHFYSRYRKKTNNAALYLSDISADPHSLNVPSQTIPTFLQNVCELYSEEELLESEDHQYDGDGDEEG